MRGGDVNEEDRSISKCDREIRDDQSTIREEDEDNKIQNVAQRIVWMRDSSDPRESPKVLQRSNCKRIGLHYDTEICGPDLRSSIKG